MPNFFPESGDVLPGDGELRSLQKIASSVNQVAYPSSLLALQTPVRITKRNAITPAMFGSLAAFAVQEISVIWVPARNRFEGLLTAWDHGGFSVSAHARTFGVYSADGDSWHAVSQDPVMSLGAGAAWDSHNMGTPSLFLDENQAVACYYWGGSEPNNAQTGVGYASTLDGVTWTKHVSNPIIPSEAEDAKYAARVVCDLANDGTTFRYTMLLNISTAESGGGSPWNIFRATSNSPTGPWTINPTPVITGTGWFTDRAEGPAILRLSASNYLVFVDNLNYSLGGDSLDYLDGREVSTAGVEIYRTNDIYAGTFEYVGNLLGDTTLFTAYPFIGRDNKVRIMFSDGTYQQGQSISIATIG